MNNQAVTTIIEQIGDITAYVLPIAITLGLTQWLVRFVLNCITGDYQSHKFF